MRALHLVLLAATALVLASVAASAAAVPAPPRVPVRQAIVTLLGPHVVRGAPIRSAPRIATVGATRPITGVATVLPVLAAKTDAAGRAWLLVQLPGRVLHVRTPPASGWISATNTTQSSTPWHLVVDLAARRLVLYRGGRSLRSFSTIVGAPSTPTPTGTFFVEENVAMPGSTPGAPFALATNARSSVLQEFEGGPGQIAIHGVLNVGGTLGTAASHGCVRLGTADVTWLARRIGPGVPVTITARAAG